MNTSTYNSSIISIRYDDPRFTIIDKYMVAQRAGFEIDQNCPRQYRQIIAACIDQGWLRPIAHMTDRELLFVGLNDTK